MLSWVKAMEDRGCAKEKRKNLADIRSEYRRSRDKKVALDLMRVILHYGKEKANATVLEWDKELQG